MGDSNNVRLVSLEEFFDQWLSLNLERYHQRSFHSDVNWSRANSHICHWLLHEILKEIITSVNLRVNHNGPKSTFSDLILFISHTWFTHRHCWAAHAVNIWSLGLSARWELDITLANVGRNDLRLHWLKNGITTFRFDIWVDMLSFSISPDRFSVRRHFSQ